MSQPPVQDRDVFARQLDKKRKGKSGFWKKLGVGVLVVVAVGAVWSRFTPKGQDFSGGVGDVVQVVRDPDLIFENNHTDQVNVLLVGEDYNWVIKPVLNPHTGKFAPMQAEDRKAPPRSDTIIIMSLDKEQRVVSMLSLPRDARVTYRDLDDDIHRDRKLNSVYASGGIDPEKRIGLLKTVLSNEFGIRIDKYAVIKPKSFKTLVEMVGGVYVNVDGALKLDRKTGKLYRGHIHYKDSWGQWEVDLDPGPQWLNGEQAHGYVRFRKDREGDPGRIRRQQLVMKAISKRVMSKPIWEVPGLAKEIETQFRTDMTQQELISLGYFAKNMGDPSRIQPMTLYGTYAGNGDILVNRPKNVKLLTALFGPSFNPEHFLVRSPSTRGDDLGPANNANPAIQAMLRKAGLLDEAEAHAEATSPIMHAPVRLDEGKPRSRRHKPVEAEARPADEEGEEGAAVSEDSGTLASEPGTEAGDTTPTTHRKRRPRSHAAGDESGVAATGSEGTETAAEPATASTESPVPRAE